MARLDIVASQKYGRKHFRVDVSARGDYTDPFALQRIFSLQRSCQRGRSCAFNDRLFKFNQPQDGAGKVVFAYQHCAVDPRPRQPEGIFSHFWYAQAIGQSGFHVDLNRFACLECSGETGGPLRFNPDLPGPHGPEPRALTDDELDQLAMPAFDGIGHDAAWFRRVRRSCPDHAGVLLDLGTEF